jgi:hypothetical protein
VRIPVVTILSPASSGFDSYSIPFQRRSVVQSTKVIVAFEPEFFVFRECFVLLDWTTEGEQGKREGHKDSCAGEASHSIF